MMSPVYFKFPKADWQGEIRKKNLVAAEKQLNSTFLAEFHFKKEMIL